MRYIAEGKFDEGIAELEEAYRILPHPNVLFNIARAHVEARRYDVAIEYYLRYLESDPEDREEVERVIADLKSRLQAQRLPPPPPKEQPQAQPSPLAAPAEEVGADELEALEQSASQLDALAQAAASEEFRKRAERLRNVARLLRERREQSQSAMLPLQSTEKAPSAQAEEVAQQGPEEAVLAPALREGETYEEAVVSSSRAAQSPLDAPNSTTIITAQDLRLSGLYEFAASLRRAAGVSIMQTDPGTYQVGIRGLNQRLANRIIVLVDGRSVYLDFIGVTLWNFIPINSEDIERIEVIRGPASALYGADAFSGIINIITRNPGEGGSYVSTSFGNQGQARVAVGSSARIDRLRIRLSGNYQRADQFAVEVDNQRFDLRPSSRFYETGYERIHFHGDGAIRLAKGVLLRLGSGVTTGRFSFQGISRLRQLRGEDVLFAQSYIALETSAGFSARVFWNRFNVMVTNQAEVPAGLELAQKHHVRRSDVIDAELIYQANFDIGGIANQVIAGVGYRFKEIDWDWIAGQIQTQHHGALFLQDSLRFSNAVQLVLSARGDLHPLVGPQVSPRGSIVVHPSEGQTIRLTGGAAFRSPTFVESYVVVPNIAPIRGATGFGVGDVRVNPERMVSVELGYMNAMTEYFSLEANGYFNFVYDFITMHRLRPFRIADFMGDAPRAQFDPQNRYFPASELYFANEPGVFRQIGGEIGIRAYPVQGLDLYANYAIHETAPLNEAAQRSPFARDARTSAHMINAGLQYRAPFGLQLAADFSWQSAQTWVEQELDPQTNQVIFTPFFLPDYATLNARAGWSLLDDHLELALVGVNLIADGHREHPFGQPIDRRFFGTATVRF
ncbi:MAG: TonB-dependent receptor [Sandaracinaceae bacterium]|nr:TonB-dependent receptor [Sandaracinaceae bacterium]